MRAAVALALALAAGAAAAGEVREPAFAGSFYPAGERQLRAAVEGFLADALPARGERPLALLVPHAGYLYSGQIAADAYRQAAGFDYDTVVVLAASHVVAPFAGVSVDAATAYRTPLGLVAADVELARALGAHPTVRYRPEAHSREHSIEVQLPFVQVALPRARVVAVIVGSPDLGLARSFGGLLARTLAGRRALIVASSDLSHYPPHAAAAASDHAVLAAVAELDAARAEAAIAREEARGHPGLVTAACGRGPLLTALVAARAAGARRGIVLSATDSGATVAGDEGRVVGYGAVALTAGAGGPDTGALAPRPSPAAGPLDGTAQAALLALARTTLERYLATGTLPLPRPRDPRLARPQSAFVTLRAGGELRGCIGDLGGTTPLALAVARAALRAATQDPRFPPVTAAELPALSLEISVLTPPVPVSGPGEVVIGRDGVVLASRGRSAVFLPQVAVERGWSRDELLTQLCRKAGLAGDCWRDARLATFQADVFGEPSAS